MKLSTSAKILIGIVVLLLLGAGGYYFYYSDSTAIPLEGTTAESDASVGQDILDLVAKLDAVKIDSTLFAGPLFSSLKDIEIPITPEVAGRGNPFAPIGAETGSVPTKIVTKSVEQ